jgi:hypothetical protein
MKCFKSPLMLLVLFIALTSCSNDAKKEASIDTFSFMKGNWVLADKGREYAESWSVNNNRMEGSAFEVALGDTVFAEEMEIFKRDEDGWVMAVRMAGENTGNTVFFTLTAHNENQVMFENANHDFPKRIAYSLTAPGAMRAIVDGGPDTEQKLEFSFVRTE